MRRPHVDDHVQLTQDIPELALARGEEGVVRSTWLAPTVAYEVEFGRMGLTRHARALLLEGQLMFVDGSMAAPFDPPAAVPHAG